MNTFALILGFLALALLVVACLCVWAEAWIERNRPDHHRWIGLLRGVVRWGMVLDVVVAALALWAGIALDKKSKREIDTLAENTAGLEAKTTALASELSPRKLPSSFGSFLKLHPVGRAQIVYKAGDDESYFFSDQLHRALRSAGWDADLSASPPTTSGEWPFALTEAGLYSSAPIDLVVHTSGSLPAWPYQDDTPVSALAAAFESSGISAILAVPHEGLRPKGETIRLVVMPKF